MTKKKTLTLAATVPGLLAALTGPAHGQTTDPRDALLERLEKRVHELEKKLEEKPVAKHGSNVAATGDNSKPELDDLSRKVRTLERKFEVEKEVTAENAKKLPKFEAGSGGFKISSQDEKHQLRIRAAVQADGSFFMDDSDNTKAGTYNPGASTHSGLADTFQLKQARIWVEGKLWNSLYYKIMPDFAASNILPDAYVDYAYFPFASLTAGKQKTPLSLERLQGDSDGMFLERAFPTYLASNRDVGVMLHGEFAKPGHKTEYGGPVDFKNFVSYQFGVFNGSGDEGSPDKNSPDTDDDKEFVGRLWAHPFQHSGNPWLEGLGLGIAGSWEQPRDQALARQRTSLGRSTYLDYSKTLSGFATPLADGDHYRVYPQAYWYSGPFGLMTEYVMSSQNIYSLKNKGKPTEQRLDAQQDNTAWQVQASYVLTGEDNTFQSVKPLQPFNPLEGKWGAVQLATRWSELNVHNDTFKILDPSKSASHATAWAVGVNWFLTSNALIRADYEQTNFVGGAGTSKDVGNRPSEKVFATRFQLAF